MYVFGEFVLDLQLYQLRRGDQVVPLEPKVFDVLRYLVEHNDRVATKRELLDALWPHEVVTEAVLPTNINALRRALGQTRGEKWPIATVHGRGYRFSMPVQRSHRPPPDEASVPSVASSLSPARIERCVGRAPLLDTLRKLLLRALAEHGQVCVLSGEAGSGKTCIARTLVELARTHGADVWTVACVEPRDPLYAGAAPPPLWACAELLRAALRSEGSEAVRRWLGPLAHDLGAVLAALDDPRDARLSAALRTLGSIRMFDALVRVVTQASRTRARMVWLEDAQHADEASWQVLRSLVPHLERASVLLLVTVRTLDEQVGEPARGELAQLLHEGPCQRFSLRGLEPSEVAEIAGAMLGGEPVSPELARALHDRSGGNPLIVHELLTWLDARARRDPDALRELPELGPGELARHLVRRRVVRVGADVKQLLEAAATTGTRWDAAVVERVSALPHRAFESALETALAHHLVVPLDARPDLYGAAHELLRETLYLDLPVRERRRLHLRVAAALEPRIAWLGVEGVRDVATHLCLALPEGEPQRAVEWLERAAELCEGTGDHREAARYYRAALDAARRLAPLEPTHHS
ncbi:MAG: AAA family ATPase, partial [Polyangiales bacterium]